MRIRAPKDFWAGVMFFAFAVVAILAARGYSLGTAGKMGPGYFPLLLGGVLGVLGAILVGRSLVIDGEPLPRFTSCRLRSSRSRSACSACSSSRSASSSRSPC